MAMIERVHANAYAAGLVDALTTTSVTGGVTMNTRRHEITRNFLEFCLKHKVTISRVDVYEGDGDGTDPIIRNLCIDVDNQEAIGYWDGQAQTVKL